MSRSGAPSAGTAPDGTYTWHLSATDAYGNGPLDAQDTFTADTVPPVLTVAGDDTPRMFSPNRDGAPDTVASEWITVQSGLVIQWQIENRLSFSTIFVHVRS